MHDLENLKEMLCEELEHIGAKGELSAGNLATVDTLAHALKNVNKIIEDKGYSGYYPYSYRRDSMGRYSRTGYSRAAGDMAERMRQLAADAPDDETRREIERMASKMASI